MMLQTGAVLDCTDGSCGVLTALVLNVGTRKVTELIVEPKHRRGLGRFDPMNLVSVDNGRLRVDCSLAEFPSLAPAEREVVTGGNNGYQDSTQLGLSSGARGAGADAFPYPELSFTIGSGSVAVGNQPVVTTGGQVGEVYGLEIDGRDYGVINVLVEWRDLIRRRTAGVPAGTVVSFGDPIVLESFDPDVHPDR